MLVAINLSGNVTETRNHGEPFGEFVYIENPETIDEQIGVGFYKVNESEGKYYAELDEKKLDAYQKQQDEIKNQPTQQEQIEKLEKENAELKEEVNAVRGGLLELADMLFE